MTVRFHPDAPPRDGAEGPLRLWLILALAAAVRWWAAVQYEALGQSDAYGHLQFLQDAMTRGRLRHPLYPPLYHLLLALPARGFAWDPYLVVRYAGVFFGTALVAIVYALTRAFIGRESAAWSAFLVAACPLFHHLQKTGVGAYPNQLGLILVPALLGAWQAAAEGRWGGAAAFLAGAVLLALSVPMMLVDLLPVLVFDGLVLRRGRWSRALRTLVYGGLLGGAALIALIARTGSWHAWMHTLGDMAGMAGDPRLDQPAAPLHLLWEYLRPKRFGLSFRGFGGGLWVVGFIGFGAWRWAGPRASARRLLAAWSAFVWTQTMFGVFQFPLYQRAGWMLLLALAVWGGAVLTALPQWVGPARTRAIRGAILLSAIASFVFPPAPRPHLSAAEDDLIRFARELRAWHDGRGRVPPPWAEAIPAQAHVTVWSRYFYGARSLQGEPLHAFLETCERITLRPLGSPEEIPENWPTDSIHLVVLDDRCEPPRASRVMEALSPDLVEAFATMQREQRQVAAALRARAEAAEREGWRVRRYSSPRGLDLLRLEAANPETSPRPARSPIQPLENRSMAK